MKYSNFLPFYDENLCSVFYEVFLSVIQETCRSVLGNTNWPELYTFWVEMACFLYLMGRRFLRKKM